MAEKTCLGCDAHKVIVDPDPGDWFCDNDEAAVCTLVPNPEQNTNSIYRADHSEFRVVVRACRPYRIKVEATVPSWCPKNT